MLASTRTRLAGVGCGQGRFAARDTGQSNSGLALRARRTGSLGSCIEERYRRACLFSIPVMRLPAAIPITCSLAHTTTTCATWLRKDAALTEPRTEKQSYRLSRPSWQRQIAGRRQWLALSLELIQRPSEGFEMARVGGGSSTHRTRGYETPGHRALTEPVRGLRSPGQLPWHPTQENT